MSTLYLIQVAGAFLGMLLGGLVVHGYLLRKRCKAAEERLTNIEVWASGASPVTMGLVGLTGLQSVDIETAQKETKH
jgi:hypothetical protein